MAIEYIFNILKLKYIYADTMGSNIRTQKIFERLGFEFINCDEHFYDMHDRREDKIDYILTDPNKIDG